MVFAKELEKRNSSLKLYGPESGNIKDFTKEYYELLSSNKLIMKYLDVFAYHSYGSDKNVNEKVEFGKWAKNNIKTPRFDMSEWCELPCNHDTKDDWSDYYIAMRYYAMAHFSKYIPSGSESLDIGFDTTRGFSAFAFKLESGEYAVVAVNFSKSKRVLEFDRKFSFCRIVETTQEHKLDENNMNNIKKLEIKPMSLATVILK